MLNFETAIEKHRNLVYAAHDYIWKHPETGYREILTGKYLEDVFEKLGYELIKAENIPGFYTVLDTGRPGPEILILGELDGLICHNHPDAHPETGAVHACGHSAQSAALVGIAAVLKEPGALDGMCGRIRLCAVPAEELIEFEYRKELKKRGTIKYFCGKTEFLHRGYFDGVDIAFMVHTTTIKNIVSVLGYIGCIVKKITYKGVAAHAGGAPWMGRNALYAANLGISAINSIRETFKEEDVIRVHPIMTEGGQAVNAIPDKVIIESYVKGANFKAVHDANERVNRALCGAAVSLGANIEICDYPAYAPEVHDEGMMKIAEAAAASAGFPYQRADVLSSGSSDLGDLSCLMPTVQPNFPGASGTVHGADFFISDIDSACVKSAIFQLEMLRLLLSDDAKSAKKILDSFKPRFASKEEYFEFIESFISEGDCISYNLDGSIEVKYK